MQDALSLSLITYEKAFQKTLLMYRSIAILTKVYNEIHRYALLTFLGIAAFAQIIPATQLIDGGASQVESITASVKAWIDLFFFLVLQNAVASMGLYVFVGDVHHKSKRCIQHLKQNLLLKKSAIISKIIKSMPSLKITFGSTNYVEKLTPVVFEHFTILRIIDTLLLSSSK